MTGKTMAGFAMVVGMLLPAARATNLLVNPGFETGDFTGWTASGTSILSAVAPDGLEIPGSDDPFPPNFVNVRSGDFAGAGLMRSGSILFGVPREDIQLTQNITVTPGQTLSLGFYMSIDAAEGIGVDIGDTETQIFVGGIGILPTGFVNLNPGNGPGNFLLFSRTFHNVAASNLEVRFQLVGSGTSRAGVSFDDFFVDDAPKVPEPGTILLLSSGLAILSARRFRRKLISRGIR